MAKSRKIKKMQQFYALAARHGGRLWLGGSQIGLRRMAEFLAEHQGEYWPGGPVEANPNRIRIALIAWLKETGNDDLLRPQQGVKNDQL